MSRIVDLIMHSIASVIKHEQLDKLLLGTVTIDDVEKLFVLSKKHDVAHIVSYSLAENGVELPDGDVVKKLKKRHPIAVIRYESLNREYERVCEAFEAEKLTFVPLKGSVIRDYYPQPWMRTSCDVDILIHEEDLQRATDILVNVCGYEKKESGSHDVSFFSQNGIHIELHYKLSEVFYDNSSGKLLESVWEYACHKKGFEYHCVLADEFYYFYHIYHMAKHFESGGCGIRPFLDLWILDNRVPHDESKRNELLEKGGLVIFADKCRKLSRYWFSNEDGDELVLKMQQFILHGGVYGTVGNKQSVRQAKNDDKVKHILGRVLMPYDKLKVQYPMLKEHKWLTPVYQVKRWFKLFKPVHFDAAKRDLETTAKREDEKSRNMSMFLEQIGLK